MKRDGKCTCIFCVSKEKELIKMDVQSRLICLRTTDVLIFNDVYNVLHDSNL